LLKRCLERDPRRRLRDIGEARIALEDKRDGVGSQAHSAVVTCSVGPTEGRPALRLRLPWLVAAGLAVLVAVFALLWWRVVRAPRPLVRSTIESPPGARLRPQRGFALSPDGRRLAFVARDADGVNSLWVRSLAARSARPLAQTEGAWKPFWSPDGRNVAFFAGASLKRVPAAGGVVQTLAEASEPRGGTWSPEGRIVFSERRTGLFEVPATGGEPKALTAVDGDAGELDHRWPIFLRDGRTVLFLVQTGEAGARDDQSRIEALDPDGARHPFLRLNSSVAYAPPRQLLFWREGSVYVQELGRRGMRVRGEPRLVAESVTFTANEWAALSVSGEGTLVYHREQDLPWRLEWRDRSGRLVSEAAPEGEYSYPALSPDGQRVAYVADHVVWVLDLARGTSTRLSYEEVDHYHPSWAPDGHWVYFVADRGREKGQELLRRPSSGLGEREVVYTAGQRIYGGSWSPDGRRVVIEEGGALLSLDLETGESRSLVQTPGWASNAQLSPDGRWLAYASDESGRDEVFVEPASGDEERWQVSRRGGYMPAWAPDGDELFFLGLDNELRVVELDLRGTPEFGLPESLFSLPGALFGVSYQVGFDGRILVRVQPSGGGAESLTLIQGWSQLLEASGY
jgi:Tol biopolymer transport system component